MPSLHPKLRKELIAAAHHFSPVVIVGQAGLSEAVLKEIDQALTAHQLVKIRLQAERDERADYAQTICRQLHAYHLRTIGKIAIFYRPNPTD